MASRSNPADLLCRACPPGTSSEKLEECPPAWVRATKNWWLMEGCLFHHGGQWIDEHLEKASSPTLVMFRIVGMFRSARKLLPIRSGREMLYLGL